MVGRVVGVRMRGRLVSAPSERRTTSRRLTGFALAVAGPAAVAAAVVPFRRDLGLAGFLLFTLIVVLAVALRAGFAPSLVAAVCGFLLGGFFFIAPYDSPRVYITVSDAPLIAYLIVGGVLGLLVDDLAAVASGQRELRRQEAALRRIATLAATGVSAHELFAAATEEVSKQVGADHATLARHETDGSDTVVASSGKPGSSGAGRPLSAPIVVDGQPWGTMSAAGAGGKALPYEAADRLERFTALLGSAIAAARSREDLAASRIRIVAAADDTRRRIERDLHDGAQQRIVALTLGLRTTQMEVPAELDSVVQELSVIADGLAGVTDDLREMARGIHPSILAEGGLGPALRTLARRSAVPVELKVDAEDRLPEPIEVAAYYVVSESLTNVAKHARASTVQVSAQLTVDLLTIIVSDDGTGGVDTSRGSGIVGLSDRVEALGGKLALVSVRGNGTTIEVVLPRHIDAGRQSAE